MAGEPRHLLIPEADFTAIELYRGILGTFFVKRTQNPIFYGNITLTQSKISDIIFSNAKAGGILMRTKYMISLTELERKYAQNIVNDKTTSETFKKRAQIILALDTSAGKPETQAKIAVRVGVTPPTIWGTIKQFSEEGLEAALQFKTPSEPNKKSIVNGEIEARIIATVCGAPPEGFGRWTVRSLSDKIELDIAPGISRETVRRTLKKLNLNLI